MRVLRPRRSRRVVLGIALSLSLFSLWLAITIPGGQIYSYVWRVTVPFFTLLIVAVLALLARPKVVVSDTGLQVTNLIRRERLQWAEIISVRFAKDAPWASLDISDGRNLPLMAIQNSDGERARRDAQLLADAILQYQEER